MKVHAIKVQEQDESELDQKLRWEAAKKGLENANNRKEKAVGSTSTFYGVFWS